MRENEGLFNHKIKKYPLACFTLIFCLGIIAASKIRIYPPLLYSLAAISLIAAWGSFKKRILFDIFLSCLIFSFGAVLLKNTQALPGCHIARLIPYKSGPSFLIGVIDNEPYYQASSTSFILKAEKIGINETWLKARGKVLAKVFGKNRFSYGDRLLLRGKLYRPFSFSGGFDYRDYLKRQGIYCVLSVKKGEMIKRLDRHAGNPLTFLGYMARSNMKAAFDKNLPSFSANIFNALILGERQNLPFWVNDGLLKSGTIHIIAISGFNIGIVAFMALLILKIIRIPRKPRYMLTIIFLFVYCVLTGANPPVVRATIMAIVLLFSYFLKREVDIYNSLSLAALIILAINPWQIFEISFQLSFLSIIFIVWLTPKITAIFPPGLCKINWARFLALTFSVSFAAWLGLLPLIAYYFKIITPVALIANMIIVPYASIIVASGFTLMLLGILAPSLAPVFAASCELSISLLFKINSLLISIPGAYFKLSGVSPAAVLFYYILLLLILNLFRIRFTRDCS
ncbi:MAG: ComEC/Rec2 family competence protein [Candidatus Omnitrophota bacterium]